VGQSIFIADATVVTLMALVFRSTDVALLAIVSIFIGSAAVDMMQKGFIRERVFFIISDNYEQMLKEVDENLGRVQRCFKVGAPMPGLKGRLS